MPTHTRLHLQPAAHDLADLYAVLRPAAPRPWLERAACVDVAISVFYPEDGADLMEALLICGSCPVRAACLDHALATRELHGIWGGTTPEERRSMMRAGRAVVDSGTDLGQAKEAS